MAHVVEKAATDLGEARFAAHAKRLRNGEVKALALFFERETRIRLLERRNPLLQRVAHSRPVLQPRRHDVHFRAKLLGVALPRFDARFAATKDRELTVLVARLRLKLPAHVELHLDSTP